MSRSDAALPSGTAARVMVAGMTAARIGVKKLRLLSKQPFLSPESFEQHRAETDDATAALLFQGLSTLRGSALKVAQMMSLQPDVWPERYRQELSKAHYRVPPLNRAVVRRLMIGEFGKAPEELFATFDATAYAAASLGQVHRATSRDGERLAVKVQYPGVDVALRNDVQLLRRFLTPRSRMAYLTGALEEIEQRLTEETEYEREGRTTQWFHAHGTIPGIVIPKVFDAYSSPRVLTTEFLDGTHLSDWLQGAPSQTERDRVAQLMYDFFMHSLFGLHQIHADPNPGNYLFRDDGTVAVVDFGSTKAFSPAFCEGLLALLQAHLRYDHDGIIPLYCALGLAGGDERRVSQRCKTALARFGEWISFPYREEIFDFGHHDTFFADGRKHIQAVVGLQEMGGFTSDSVLFDRTIYGLFGVFTHLGARVRMHNQWLS